VVYAFIVDRLCTTWETRHPPGETRRRRTDSVSVPVEHIYSDTRLPSGANFAYQTIIETNL
jgi:hypothetical protein